jgi:steroid delta-isomerase
MGAQENRETAERYVDLVGTGTADQIAELYAPDATVEDPIGTDPRHGIEAIREFYGVIEPLARKTELRSMRVVGNEAAIVFTLHTEGHGYQMTIDPIDVMTFDDQGRITSMRAYWGPEDMRSEKL